MRENGQDRFMDFNLTKEQRDIVRAAKEIAQGEFPDKAKEFDQSETFDLDLWIKACELGFVGVFIDEKCREQPLDPPIIASLSRNSGR